ncbi:MAG: hypothetical protein D6696_02865 [Acidobacteria bacterium]|nr:MAG: hypothetical protein D6696_02865 [Acidobacteriota bacterium]
MRQPTSPPTAEAGGVTAPGHRRLRVEAARRLGCEITDLDPETGYLYEIRRDGKALVLLGGFSPLNSANAARIASDKFHTGLVLERAGLRAPRSARCLKPGYFEDEDFPHAGTGEAHRLAERQGFPLIVKPNRGARGRDVVVVEDDDAMVAAIEAVWERDYVALVQVPVAGIDVRLDFLDGEYLFGYLRRPVRLAGDGRSSLRRLLAACDARFAGERFLEQLPEDPIWRQATATRGLDLESVLAAGEALAFESPILNLNRLCLADYLPAPPPAWLAQGLAIGRLLGLRHFGIDWKAGSLDADPASATVLEVNSSPSLLHMSRMGYYEEALAAEMKVVAAALDAA